MSFLGIHILTDAQLAVLKAAGHQVETTAITVAQHAIAAAKDTPLGQAVTSAINDATTTSLPVGERLEKVVSDVAPEVLKLAASGGFSGVLGEVESFARELVQTMFDAEKSTTAGTVATSILSALIRDAVERELQRREG